MSPREENISKDDVKISVVTEADRARVLEFLKIYYYQEEPLTIGLKPTQPDKDDIEFTMSNVAHGTCLMAQLQEKVVGAVMAGPKGTNEAKHLLQEAEKLGDSKWGKTVRFLERVEREANVFEKFKIEKALHAHSLGVDSAVRGKALGARLMAELMELGRQKNFPLLTVDCTSVFSQRLCERLGMECVNALYYCDYRNAAGEQVFCPPAPHDCVKTYALRLSKKTENN